MLVVVSNERHLQRLTEMRFESSIDVSLKYAVGPFKK